MNEAHGYRQSLLRNLRRLRERAGISTNQLEEHLILGPGWIGRFEEGQTTPGIDMVLAIPHEIGASLSDLLTDLPTHPGAGKVERFISVEQAGKDLLVNFQYSEYYKRSRQSWRIFAYA